jgi:NitT/TauT family transport system permease protein
MASSAATDAPADARFRLGRRQWVLLGRIGLGVVVLLGWEALAREMGPLLLSPPSQVLGRVGKLIASGELFIDIGVTLLESLVGLVLGTVAGVAVPLFLRLSPRLTQATLPYFRAGIGVPKLALAPLLMLWFGIGLNSKFVLVAVIVFFVVFEPTFAGLQAVDRQLEMMARILGASEWQVTRKIVWNSTIPFVFAALKNALPWSVSAAVVGEFISGTSGLGVLITKSNDMGDVTGVFAGVVVVTALVLALDIGLGRIQARALSWRSVDSRAQL